MQVGAGQSSVLPSKAKPSFLPLPFSAGRLWSGEQAQSADPPEILFVGLSVQTGSAWAALPRGWRMAPLMGEQLPHEASMCARTSPGAHSTCAAGDWLEVCVVAVPCTHRPRPTGSAVGSERWVWNRRRSNCSVIQVQTINRQNTHFLGNENNHLMHKREVKSAMKKLGKNEREKVTR